MIFNIGEKKLRDSEIETTSINHNHQSRKTNWKVAAVDFNSPYFKLMHGNILENEKPKAVAYIGQPSGGCFPVCFALSLDKNERIDVDIVKDAKRDLDFYLCELPAERRLKADAVWDYQQYHCGTAANIYGRIHWELVENEYTQS